MVKVLVPISGGKDSQACLKLALQHYDASEVRGLFCDTQFEHPDTYLHIEALRSMYGEIRIDTVSGGSVLEKSVKYGRFPGGGARHCTDELKIRETKIYCRELAAQQGGFEVWYGMRARESNERAKRYAGKLGSDLYQPHEVMPSKYPKYLGKMGVRFRLPILEWTDADVLDFLAGEENPLYRAGFPRVGCFPCLASGDYFKEKAFQHDEFGRFQLARVIRIAKEIGKPVFTSKGGQARNAALFDDGPGCMICET